MSFQIFKNSKPFEDPKYKKTTKLGPKKFLKTNDFFCLFVLSLVVFLYFEGLQKILKFWIVLLFGRWNEFEFVVTRVRIWFSIIVFCYISQIFRMIFCKLKKLSYMNQLMYNLVTWSDWSMIHDFWYLTDILGSFDNVCLVLKIHFS